MDIYVFVMQMRWIAVRHRRVAWGLNMDEYG